MIKNKLIFLILLVGLLLSQGGSGISPSYIASFGSVTMNNKVYNQISFTPEIPISNKIGLGLEFYLYFDENGELYGENWDFSSSEASFRTLIDKIKYFRYGQPIDDIYFRIGSLPDVTFGYGILVGSYSNSMDYPQARRVGFDFRYTFSDFRLEIVHSDLKEIDSPSLFGIRGVIPFAEKFNMGISLITDLNQIEGLVDTDEDGFPDYVDYFPNNSNIWSAYQDSMAIEQSLHDCIYGSIDQPCPNDVENVLTELDSLFQNQQINYAEKDEISGIGLDFSYFINERWTIYSEFAHLIGKTKNPYNEIDNPDEYNKYDVNLGYGVIPFGMIGRLGKNYEVTFTMDLRQCSDRFVFQYWNQNYDHNRVMVDGNELTTKESKLYNYGNLKGLNIGITANIAKYLKFSMSYLHMIGDIWDGSSYVEDENNSFYTGFEIDTSIIPKVRVAELYYQQLNTPNPFDFDLNENTLIGLNIGVDIAENMALIFKGRQTYICELNICEDNDDWTPIRNTQIETSIYF
tara:strand:+ start:710 stop:2260 length:1551 start_codon:yes stop_codon:yes gene_type:complete